MFIPPALTRSRARISARGWRGSRRTPFAQLQHARLRFTPIVTAARRFDDAARCEERPIPTLTAHFVLPQFCVPALDQRLGRFCIIYPRRHRHRRKQDYRSRHKQHEFHLSHATGNTDRCALPIFLGGIPAEATAPGHAASRVYRWSARRALPCHTRLSAMTFSVAATTTAHKATFDTVSMAPSISTLWTAVPMTMTAARSV